MRKSKKLFLVIATAALTALPWTAAAQGAGTCSFSVSASPESVAEGETVTVTVRREQATNQSSVDVETLDEGAKAPGDYDPIPKQTMHFTSETSKTLSIGVKDDAASEPEESFRVRISNAHCGDLTVFTIGNPAVVTIQASDAVSPDPPPGPDQGTSSNQGLARCRATRHPLPPPR